MPSAHPLLAAAAALTVSALTVSSALSVSAQQQQQQQQQQPPPVVQTAQGAVRGVPQRAGATEAFLGIPFAQPPVGALRFAPPAAPAASWAPRVRDATRYAHSCVQAPPDPRTGFDDRNFTLAEDCLYLNVWRPAGRNASSAASAASSSALLPVLFFIHGGSFTSGGGALYDGGPLGAPLAGVAPEGTVVVTINYRLGPFGFLYTDALHQEQPQSAGAMGLLDQQAALRWVQENIAAFGGDPKNVLLFGESAGAISVCAHLAMPGSKGLFARALMQSGLCSLDAPTKAVVPGSTLEAKLGCPSGPGDMACMRNKTAAEIQKALENKNLQTWYPVVSPVSPLPLPAYAKKEAAIVPLVVGTNLDESAFFMCPLYENITAAEYVGLVDKFYGKAAPYVLQEYPKNPVVPVEPLIQLESDVTFKCPTKALIAAVGPVLPPTNPPKTYMYSFRHTPGYAKNLGRCLDVPAHSFELAYMWPSLRTIYLQGYKLTAEEEVLAEQLRTAWVTFAAGGDPWAPLPNANPDGTFTIFSTPSDRQPATGDNFRKSECAFWAQMTPPSTE